MNKHNLSRPDAIRDALAVIDCFLEQRGCFPLDNPRWKEVMTEVYKLVGQPGMPFRQVLASSPAALAECPSCHGLNTSCPDGCGRDPATGEPNGTRLASADASAPVDEVATTDIYPDCVDEFAEYDAVEHETLRPASTAHPDVEQIVEARPHHWVHDKDRGGYGCQRCGERYIGLQDECRPTATEASEASDIVGVDPWEDEITDPVELAAAERKRKDAIARATEASEGEVK